MSLEQLPEELLLQVALHLPDSTTPKHLKNLSLTSKKLSSVAQEALHTTARLSISCGCHPRVNAVVKLLRTVLDRPDLASKVKTLRFRAVRKRVQKLYEEQGFDFVTFRARCISRVEELGYKSTHPWQRSISNSVESAFGGLLLALLPNLNDLDFWIKDHQRGPPSSECISGLWGATSPPNAVLKAWKNISRLITGDTSLLKCGIQFDTLTSLDLRTISIGTVLRLNGPGSLLGAESLEDLALTVSIQFADRPLVEKAEIQFSELLDALACHALKNLKIIFINDGYHVGDDLMTELNTGYFLGQLGILHNTLETLSISLETADDDGELEWLVDMWQHPTKSLKDFTALKSLVIPQPFIFTASSATWNTSDNCHPNDLPPRLERLEILYPHEDVEDWAKGFLTEDHSVHSDDNSMLMSEGQGHIASFKELVLTCRDDVGIGADYFTEGVDKLWWRLSAYSGIETEVYDQLRDRRHNLVRYYEEEEMDEVLGLEDDESDEENEVDEDGWEDGEVDAQLVGDRVAILDHLRTSANPQGSTLNELCTALAIPLQRVGEITSRLFGDGNIRFTGAAFPQAGRYHFVRETDELRGLDIMRDLLGEGSIPALSTARTELADGDEGGWETGDSMPELEPYDFETPAQHARRAMGISSYLPWHNDITPTNVLRCLRDTQDPSEGLTYSQISHSLGCDNEAEVAFIVRQLIHDGHVRNKSTNDKVYFVEENEAFRAEDMD